MPVKTTIIRRGVILDKHTDNIISARSELLRLGSRGYSAALRIIVNEWAAQNADCACQPNSDMACPTCRQDVQDRPGDTIPIE